MEFKQGQHRQIQQSSANTKIRRREREEQIKQRELGGCVLGGDRGRGASIGRRRASGWIPTREPRGGPASCGEEHQIQLGHDPTTCDALGTMETKPSVSSDLLGNRPSLFLQTDSAVFSYFFSHVIYFLTWNTLPTADCGACREKVNYLKIKKSSKRSLYNAGR
jgi:hypothetical protein